MSQCEQSDKSRQHDTPRTDAAKFPPAPGTHGHEWVYAEDARQFERELSLQQPTTDDVREALATLVADVENKWGDPHTLRHAKAALAQSSISATSAAPSPGTDVLHRMMAAWNDTFGSPLTRYEAIYKIAAAEALTRITSATASASGKHERLAAPHNPNHPSMGGPSPTILSETFPEGRRSPPAGALESGSPLEVARNSNPGGAVPGGGLFWQPRADRCQSGCARHCQGYPPCLGDCCFLSPNDIDCSRQEKP